MMKKLFIVLLLLAAVPVMAAEEDSLQGMKKTLQEVFGSQPDSISAAPVKGLYEVSYGPKLYYVSTDGHYLFSGDLIDLHNRTNLTEKNRAGVRLKAMSKIDDSDMIIYKAKGKEKHQITVFTDIDCGYCRKLHSGMAKMNDLGITVRYMAFPRAGIGSHSYDKAVSVWCAKDRHKAMDNAKAGIEPPKANCDAPVKKEYLLGKAIGVTGTPAIVLKDGTLMPGYLPPQRLAAALEQSGN